MMEIFLGDMHGNRGKSIDATGFFKYDWY